MGFKMLVRMLCAITLLCAASPSLATYESIIRASYDLADQAEIFEKYLRTHTRFVGLADDLGQLHMSTSALYHHCRNYPGSSRQIPSYFSAVEARYLQVTKSYLQTLPYNVDRDFENRFAQVRRAANELDYTISTN